jgi:hypothetical protein
MCKNYSPRRFNGNPTGISHVEQRDFRMVTNMRKAHDLSSNDHAAPIFRYTINDLESPISNVCDSEVTRHLTNTQLHSIFPPPEKVRFFWRAIYE